MALANANATASITAQRAAKVTSRDLGLERKLRRAMQGEVRFDAFTRGALRHRCLDLPDHADGRGHARRMPRISKPR